MDSPRIWLFLLRAAAVFKDQTWLKVSRPKWQQLRQRAVTQKQGEKQGDSPVTAKAVSWGNWPLLASICHYTMWPAPQGPRVVEEFVTCCHGIY